MNPKLTVKEKQIYDYLCQHRDEFCSPTKIALELFPDEFSCYGTTKIHKMGCSNKCYPAIKNLVKKGFAETCPSLNKGHLYRAIIKKSK